MAWKWQVGKPTLCKGKDGKFEQVREWEVEIWDGDPKDLLKVIDCVPSSDAMLMLSQALEELASMATGWADTLTLTPEGGAKLEKYLADRDASDDECPIRNLEWMLDDEPGWVKDCLERLGNLVKYRRRRRIKVLVVEQGVQEQVAGMTT